MKEGAGEDGEAREADFEIKVDPSSEALDICHWTSSSHPYHPSPLNGRSKLSLNIKEN